jgi:hypothetical protein
MMHSTSIILFQFCLPGIIHSVVADSKLSHFANDDSDTNDVASTSFTSDESAIVDASLISSFGAGSMESDLFEGNDPSGLDVYQTAIVQSEASQDLSADKPDDCSSGNTLPGRKIRRRGEICRDQNLNIPTLSLPPNWNIEGTFDPNDLAVPLKFSDEVGNVGDGLTELICPSMKFVFNGIPVCHSGNDADKYPDPLGVVDTGKQRTWSVVKFYNYWLCTFVRSNRTVELTAHVQAQLIMESDICQ